jgi:eukaryotic-like serine/threonine-protein kinase
VPDLPRTFGRYTLLALLGEGGMATVYLAEFRGPAGFRKRAALKVIRWAAVGEDEARTRALINEARVGGLLKHPNIVDTYDFGLVDDHPYVAMELVEGVDLARLLQGRGPLPPAVALSVCASICAGLQHAHNLADGGRLLQLVHRDLKPSNVLVGPSGEVKVVDFGLAKATAVGGDTTATGLAKGTPPYMSPEQLRAEPLDRRSDLFALGAVLYELLTGERFFDQPTAPSIIMAINEVERHIAPPSKLARLDELAPGATALAHRCLRYAPDQRPDDATEIRLELQRLAAGLSMDVPADDWLADAVAELVPTSAWDVVSPATDEEPIGLYEGGSSGLANTVMRSRGGSGPLPGTEIVPPDQLPSTRPMATPAPRAPRRWPLGLLALLVALAAAALWFARGDDGAGSPAEPVAAIRTVLMTPAGNLEGQPTLSPDGTKLVFVREEEDRVSLWELDLDTDQRTLLLSIPGEYVKHPAWAPDGKRLALVRDLLVPGIYVVDRAALPEQGEAALRRVTDFGSHPAWSPDGQRIAFSTASHEATSEVSYAMQAAELWTVDVAERNTTRLHDSGGNMPDWSPSGERLAFWAIDDAGRRNVFTIPASGGDPVAVTEGVALDWNPRWDPDGQHLWFLSDRSGAGALWRVPVDERTGVASGPAVAVTTGGNTAPGFLSFDGTGKRLAFHELTRRWNIQVVPVDPQTGRPTGEPRWLTRGDRRILAASPSPDGSQVVFWERRTHEDLSVIDVATGQERQLIDDVWFDRAPQWSPDGARIAFFSNRDGGWAVWTMAADGSDPIRAVVGAGWMAPRWSPDSRRLAVFDLELRRIVVVTLGDDGKEASRESVLTQAEEGELPAQYGWSPDGKRLLLGWEDELTWDARHAVYELATSELTPVVHAEAEHLRWFDDDRLLGAADDGAGLILWPGGETEVTLEMDDSEGLWTVELSADRSLLMMMRGEETAAMRVMELDQETP